MTEADTERLRGLFAQARWTFARTMPESPHEYTLRATWPDDGDFAWAVETIRTHGRPEWFKGRAYVVLKLDGHAYWTMGQELRRTVLINRREL